MRPALYTFFVVLAGVWLGSVRAQTAMSVEELVARVQANTDQFEHSLPNFVCDEKVSSSLFHRGKQHDKTIESRFVGVQKRNRNVSFTESREVVSVNGQPAAKDQRYEGPFLFGGGFSSMLSLTFGLEASPYHTYTLAGEETVNGRPAFVLTFKTKEGQHHLFFLIDGKTVVNNDIGKAWIDKESYHVLRLERRYLNVGKNQGPLAAVVDYAEVQIGGQPFWMPKTVHAWQSAMKGGDHGEFSASYSNYRKFDVSSAIAFDEK